MQDGYGEPLTIRAFGVPAFSFGGVPLGFAHRESVALLMYLAITRRSHTPDALAHLLWGNLPQERAAANLRAVVTELRERVGEAVVSSRHAIGLNPDHRIVLDVAAFDADVERGIATGDPQLLARAVQTYRDDFLLGFSLPTADAFDEWTLLYREHLRERLIAALGTLAAIYTDRGEYRAALTPARRAVVLDPWREEAHRHLMILLARSGNRAAAITQFIACRQILADELGCAPMPETISLYERLVSGSAETNNGLLADR